jgi:DNA processing protein
MARALGLALAQAGWPVVSGLAEGIDGAVHGGCLAGDGAPVGVLGTPLERVYPQHHGHLQRAVGLRGLLLSEQPPGAQVHRGNFAGRNRLLVALAAAVVVVECPPDSGALHSAAYAWEQGLPLWVVIAAIVVSIIFLSELASNVATCTAFLPVAAALATGALGVDALLLTVPATLAASAAFMLPVGTPPNAIVFGTGHVTMSQMVRAGFGLNLSLAVMITVIGLTLVRWVFGV